MREHLMRIGQEYRDAKKVDFKSHALAKYIRRDAARALEASLGNDTFNLKFKCSAGQGGWTAVPWLGVFERTITPAKAEYGYYIVYLFHASERLVYLSLNQGVTALEEEFGKQHKKVLSERASLMRLRLPEFLQTFNVHAIELGSSGRLAKGYELGHAMGKCYAIDALPSEEILASDLRSLVRAYRTLVDRGGIGSGPDIGAYDLEDLGRIPGMQEDQAGWLTSSKDSNSLEAKASRGGQGYGLKPLERIAVEQHAMLLAKNYLESEGYQVKDVSRTRPYDYTASKDGEEYIVEVKGTTGDPVSIFLTIREIMANKLKYPRNILIVVHSIKLDKAADPPKADAGIRIVQSPWRIEEEFLRPITFQYSPKSGF